MLLQVAEGDNEERSLPALEAINALNAAWEKVDAATAQSYAGGHSQHLALALEPGQIPCEP